MDDPDLLARMAALRGEGRAFVLATVVRTVAATPAKAGAKAIVTEDGQVHGWIGGGCTEGTVRQAAGQALADGRARLISVQPKEALETAGLPAGDARYGLEFHASMCPSGGTTDVFVEPMLPLPLVVVLGTSPVARAIADLAPRVGLGLTVVEPPQSQAASPAVDRHGDEVALASASDGQLFIVVATQGRRDFEALEVALATNAVFVAFVGSRRKMAVLRERLIAGGVAPARADAVRCPGGLDIGAITPEENALSVLADIVRECRLPARESAQEQALVDR